MIVLPFEMMNIINELGKLKMHDTDVINTCPIDRVWN
jgi:hypothetical protein